MDFLRAPDETFLDELRFVAGRAAGFDISFNMAFCCRCISADQKPRAAPAQVLADYLPPVGENPNQLPADDGSVDRPADERDRKAVNDPVEALDPVIRRRERMLMVP